jgi:2-polyprenyl-3-methyl-5-hydroxy-6-metoxy-1,4-benzoquinol methylase
MTQATDVADGERFPFGRNWQLFLRCLTEERIETAARSLSDDLGVRDLTGRRFLDIGCGSGLFSLAARRLGATVHSFDYDPASVACALELRRRYFPDDRHWTVEEGSALDRAYIESLGEFEVVYSWGVLHHTGDMWRALENATVPVAPGGMLFIAIYNDCGAESLRWRKQKQRYNSLPAALRPAYALLTTAPYELKAAARAALDLRPLDYVRSWTQYRSHRGMSRWRDTIDWVGGYPYEFATVDDLLKIYGNLGFKPKLVRKETGLGCHELVLVAGAGELAAADAAEMSADSHARNGEAASHAGSG